MENIIEYVETSKASLKEPALVVGIPDTGLAGSIALSFISEKLGLAQIGHFESDRFPPMAVVHEKKPVSPLRLYAGPGIAILISEMPIPFSLSYDLSRALIKWFREENGSLLISTGGLVDPKRADIEVPKVYAVGTNDKTRALIDANGFASFEEGLVLGPNGAILRDCMRHELPAVYLMAESYGKYPDPGAAASLVAAVSRMLKLDIDTKELLAKGEEIRMSVRDLMKRTQTSIDEQSKTVEKETPVMYR